VSGRLFVISLLQKTARGVAGMLGRESWFARCTRPAYRFLLILTGGRRGMPWVINGVRYRIDARHYHHFAPDLEAPVAAFLSERVKPGALCFDVGASVGAYVLQFAHWCGPSGKVVAFEPNPAAREILSRHVQWNGLTERVHIVPAAVGATGGEAVLYAAEASEMSRLGAPNAIIADRVSPITVPVTTLDSYCEATGLEPDWLLIDVEGFEMGVLAGARNLIERRGRLLGIVVEMHPDVWHSADTSRAQAEDLLGGLGLEAIPLSGQGDPFREYGQVCLVHK
jgi:FkbM family methyltransferase